MSPPLPLRPPSAPRRGPIVRAVEAAVQRHGIEGAPIVVAVSGGADSTALLRAMGELRPGGDLIAAHFNHRLRGAESDGDAAFVRALATSHGIRFVGESAPAPSPRTAGSGDEGSASPSEEALRRERYRFLERTAAVAGAPVVLTAHTADDQAETILHHLLRGTGLRGLGGIPACRLLSPSSGLLLVRPFLDVSRAEITAWLTELGQPWRTDSSNESAVYTRNRLRRDLLPLLRGEHQPDIDSKLRQLGAQAREVSDYLRGEARQLLAGALVETGEGEGEGEVVLKTRTLELAPRVLVREAMVELWTDRGWPRQRMTFGHWERLVDVLVRVHRAVELPEGIQARRRQKWVRITRGEVGLPEPGQADSRFT
ncbi:tRNA lysidine(34) synthetase TilS [Planctomyces sp. SH-PL14]|uniref:tRNA lysidine(34) synthetase TilS n=1 Tax=Planctomyces sp. SH-PL14 TaxID=1632864 RepID=UPI0018D45FCF|nr:tRNA lysidine(34) synthetase TilS [Planctomyces sp. SH-PL14]